MHGLFIARWTILENINTMLHLSEINGWKIWSHVIPFFHFTLSARISLEGINEWWFFTRNIFHILPFYFTVLLMLLKWQMTAILEEEMQGWTECYASAVWQAPNAGDIGLLDAHAGRILNAYSHISISPQRLNFHLWKGNDTVRNALGIMEKCVFELA